MRILFFVAAAALAGCGAATAQEAAQAPISHGDVHFVVGWQNIRREQPQPYSNDWMNGILYGGAGAGWYWTDHLKTQVDIGAGTEGHQYRFDTVVINGQSTGLSSRISVRQQSVAIAQHYQFFRNRWFHPHVGAGAHIARETTTEAYNPVIVYDSVARVSRQVTAARTEGPDHRMLARPFVDAGFKVYMTRRAFFTTDARVVFQDGLDQVLFRFGFGTDF